MRVKGVSGQQGTNLPAQVIAVWVEAEGPFIASALVGEFGDSRCLAHITRYLAPRLAFGALAADAGGGADGRSRFPGQMEVGAAEGVRA